MTLRDELEALDIAVLRNRHYSFDQKIWQRMLNVLDAVDSLGVAISDAGYTWTPRMREAYEIATSTVSASSASGVKP